MSVVCQRKRKCISGNNQLDKQTIIKEGNIVDFNLLCKIFMSLSARVPTKDILCDNYIMPAYMLAGNACR